MKLVLPLLLCLLWRTAVAETAAATTTDSQKKSLVPGLTAANYPRLNGSTSTIPLGLLLAAKVWGYEAELRRGGNPRSHVSGAVDLTFPLETPPERIEEFGGAWSRHQHQGTHEAYQALANGEADLILVARLPSRDESTLAKTKNVTFDAQPIALDALVFLANRKNPVENVTQSQLVDVFTGQTRLWRLLSGLDWPILALARNAESGSQELVESLLLRDHKLAGNEVMTRVSTMGEIINRVAANDHAIGYSVFYYERFMAPRTANKTLKVDGVTPSAQSIAERRYPFVAPVYAVTRTGLPPDTATIRLRDWLRSEAGQNLVAASGYVPARSGNGQ